MPLMTSNTTPVPFVASASSEVPNSSAPTASGRAFQAFSADVNAAWIGLFGPTAYLQIDYGIPSSKALSSYTIKINTFSVLFFSNRAPRDWIVEASADLLTWDLLDTRSGQTWGSFGNPSLPSERTYQCAVADGTRYQYFRITITAITGADTYTEISKWKLGSSFNRVY